MRTSPLRHPARLAGASLLRLQTDERLAELAIDGHEAAFDAIVVRHRAAIQRYCAGIVGPSRAEDAAQQTLINAHDALKRTDEVRHLRSWLYRIAHNVSLNVLRAVRDDVPLEDVSTRDAVGSIADGPAESFERSERFRATVAALQSLPERQRAALVLRELEGRSHEEIADALGVTKGSARQHLMRARVAVRSAATAITPYPLLTRLTDMMSGPANGGWAEAVAGAGAGATLTKLTAGVVATGALVGGAVGTQQVVHRDGSATTRAAEVAGAAKPATAAGGPPAAASPVAVTVADRAAATRGGAQQRRTRSGDGTSHRRRSASAGGGGSKSPVAAQPGSGADDGETSDTSHRNGDRADRSGDRGESERESKSEKKSGSGSQGSGEHGSSGKANAKKDGEDSSSNGSSKPDAQDKSSGDDAAETPATTTTEAADDNGGGSGSAGAAVPDDASTETTTTDSSGSSKDRTAGAGDAAGDTP